MGIKEQIMGRSIPVLQLCKVGHSGGVNQIRARPHVIVSWADTGQVQFDAHEDERFATDSHFRKAYVR